MHVYLNLYNISNVENEKLPFMNIKNDDKNDAQD